MNLPEFRAADMRPRHVNDEVAFLQCAASNCAAQHRFACARDACQQQLAEGLEIEIFIDIDTFIKEGVDIIEEAGFQVVGQVDIVPIDCCFKGTRHATYDIH